MSNQHISRGYRIIPKYHYRMKINNNGIHKKDNNFGKTLFSKVTQIMFESQKINEFIPKKNVINLDLEGTDDYNKLTEEKYLNTYDKKPKENNKVISDFLERKKNEQISKRIKMEKKMELISEALKDFKRLNTLTDRNRSFKSTRTVFKFLQDQKDCEEKHNNLLKKNEKIQKDKENLNIRDRPLLNEESINIVNKKLNNKEDIHLRLYKDFNEKKKKEEEKEKEKSYTIKNKGKKVFIKKIEETTERLFNEYKKRIKRKDENIKDIQLKQKNLSFLINKNSNEIINKKLEKKIENAFQNIFSKQIIEEFDVCYDEFIQLLIHIGFIKKNYSELINSDKSMNDTNIKNKTNFSRKKGKININNSTEIDSEYNLVKQLWKNITKTQSFNTDIIAKSTNLVFYLFNIIEINSNEDNKVEHKKATRNYINLKNSVNITEHNLHHIYKNFQLFRNNAINSLYVKENNSNRMIRSENKHTVDDNIKRNKNEIKNNKYKLNKKTLDNKTTKLRKLKSGNIDLNKIKKTKENKKENESKLMHDIDK